MGQTGKFYFLRSTLWSVVLESPLGKTGFGGQEEGERHPSREYSLDNGPGAGMRRQVPLKHRLVACGLSPTSPWLRAWGPGVLGIPPPGPGCQDSGLSRGPWRASSVAGSVLNSRIQGRVRHRPHLSVPAKGRAKHRGWLEYLGGANPRLGESKKASWRRWHLSSDLRMHNNTS